MINLSAQLIGIGRRSEGIIRGIRRQRLRQAMEDSLRIIMQSTIMGFKNRVAPDGTPWVPNAPWYSTMKGVDLGPNVGPAGKTIKGGPFAKTHEFESINHKRMMQSLMTENTATRGVVRYEEQARERAAKTQSGGTSEFAIITKSSMGSGRLAFNVRAMERPHLGVATYPRISGRTDAQWVEFYFGEQVEISLRDDLSYF